MITVLLLGGLGNQMFQYAAAKALAERLGTSLAVDTYALGRKSKTTQRNLELEIFNIQLQYASPWKSRLAIKARPWIWKHRQRSLQYLNIFADSKAIEYDAAFDKLGNGVLLSGYFQNEAYFRDAVFQIRHDFLFRTPLDDKNSKLADEMRSRQSVAVHIRRGDYISDANAATNFASCTPRYYEKAIGHMIDKCDNAAFYVFSEDMEWVKENISFAGRPVRYIDWNTGCESYRDMQLMSLCRHNIIANSSFSWWAAWLNMNKNKIVIAPNQWYKDNRRNTMLDKFYPQGWIQM